MSEKISRRNFLRTATLGAAAAGLLAGCGNSAASGSTAASTAAAVIANFFMRTPPSA